MSTDELKPLPEPTQAATRSAGRLKTPDLFSGTQMHAYAREHIAERDARIAALEQALRDMTADRDSWERQHRHRCDDFNAACSERDDADAQLEAARAELRRATATAEEQMVRADEAEAEAAELRADAERYRALRLSLSRDKRSISLKMPRVLDPFNDAVTYLPDGLDQAIDSAIQADHTEQRLAMVDPIQADKGAA